MSRDRYVSTNGGRGLGDQTCDMSKEKRLGRSNSVGTLATLLVLAAAALFCIALGHSSAQSNPPPEFQLVYMEQLSRSHQVIMAMLTNLTAGTTTATPAAPQRPSHDEPGQVNAAQQDKLTAAFAAIPDLTSLHNKLLRSSHSYEHHRTLMLAVFDHLVHLETEAALADTEKKLLQPSSHPAELFSYRLYKLLLNTGRLIPCREDATLMAEDTHDSPQHGQSRNKHHSAATPSRKYFFATNLRDNNHNMPQFILSLLQTLLRLPQHAAFVSVYESNSDDGAFGWIDVLQLALNVIGTPSRLVTRGMLVSLKGTQRIEHLARVRNMALSPLYQHYAAARTIKRQARQPDSESHMTAVFQDAAHLLPGQLPWDPDFVVFINDVYFCWGQVIRLLKHEADITCGVDFWQSTDATNARPAAHKPKTYKPKPDMPPEYQLERPVHDPLAPDQINPIVFYDIWVARDLAGNKFWWDYPYVGGGHSRQAAMEGLPFRASCCWNGMAVLRADPFKAGLKFRPAQEQECKASECTFVCNDFARLGFDNVVVDAGVQLSYDWDLAREMSALGIEGHGQSTWAQVKAAGIADHDRSPRYNNMECCSLKKNSMYVNFYSDCFREDIMSQNHTQMVLV